MNKSRNLQNNPKKTKWVPGHSEVPSSQPVGMKMAKERMWPSDGWLVGMEERKRWEQKRQKQRWVSVGRGKNVAGGKNHVRKGLGEENNTAQSPSQSLTMQPQMRKRKKTAIWSFLSTFTNKYSISSYCVPRTDSCLFPHEALNLVRKKKSP